MEKLCSSVLVQCLILKHVKRGCHHYENVQITLVLLNKIFLQIVEYICNVSIYALIFNMKYTSDIYCVIY